MGRKRRKSVVLKSETAQNKEQDQETIRLVNKALYEDKVSTDVEHSSVSCIPS